MLLLLFTATFTSCGDDETPEQSYTVPATYDFENVSYSGQTQRLAMLNDLKTYMKTGVSADVQLDAERLLGKYENTNDADWDVEYDDSKQLKSKTFDAAQDDFAKLLNDLALTSENGGEASSGVAGIAVSANGEKSYLLNQNGVEELQIIEKGLMGACFYYQATSVYFGEGKMSGDNITIEAGKGTEMEHAWDEAFGYLGVSTEFPTDLDGLFFWGDYLNDRNELLGLNEPLMLAFRTGRAAISNDDLATRDAQIAEARKLWEKAVAATAIHYINSTIDNFNDYALSCHALSEAVAFIYSLKFNEERSFTNSEINLFMEQLGGSSDITQLNLLDTTISGLESVRSTIAEKTSLTEQMEEL